VEGPVLAVDIGGTKFAAGVVDVGGRLLASATRPTVPGAGSEDLFGSVVALVDEVDPSRTCKVVGVGCGGPMSRGGDRVSPLNIPGWREFPLRARLAELVGRRVHVDNDAKALALAEGWCGAAVGEPNYMAMVVSTGVGGGIVVDGRLLDGASGNAGHVGHVVVEPAGRVDERHARGVLEVEASGSAIADITGRPADEATAEVVERTGRLVGRAVASVCNLLDLPLVVVAGSVALGFGAPFFAAAQDEIDRICLLDFSRGARIVPAGLGAEGPLVGAAAVAVRAEGGDVGVR
jgi:glucokinase